MRRRTALRWVAPAALVAARRLWVQVDGWAVGGTDQLSSGNIQEVERRASQSCQDFGTPARLTASHASRVAWPNVLRECANAALRALQDSLPAWLSFCNCASASAA